MLDVNIPSNDRYFGGLWERNPMYLRDIWIKKHPRKFQVFGDPCDHQTAQNVPLATGLLCRGEGLQIQWEGC